MIPNLDELRSCFSADELARFETPTPLVEIHDERVDAAGVRLFLKRDDLAVGRVRGNKRRKLKYNIAHARHIGARRVLTFGGAWSNHIAATAAAGAEFGIETIGVIRGDERSMNPVLEQARTDGMQLDYIDREMYRRKTDANVIEGLQKRWGDFLLIPEGGSNALALAGCRELVGELRDPFEVICTAVGTGGTLAGLSVGISEEQTVIGFAALKGAGFLETDVRRLLREADARSGKWSLELGWHFGGYARATPALTAFIQRFHDTHGIRLDPIYTGKMMFGLFEMIRSGRFRRGGRIVAVHTGGTDVQTV
jgi:1-aminocyclopropane-1-carboxylate deaminase